MTFFKSDKWLPALVAFVCTVGFLFLPESSYASFESSLIAIKTKVTMIVLPLLAVIGLAFAGMSFLTGNINAKQHMLYAVIGCVVGFGAQAIVGFIASTVN